MKYYKIKTIKISNNTSQDPSWLDEKYNNGTIKRIRCSSDLSYVLVVSKELLNIKDILEITDIEKELDIIYSEYPFIDEYGVTINRPTLKEIVGDIWL